MGGLGGGLSCGSPGLTGPPSGGILLFDSLFLPPAGDGIAGKLGILPQALLIQGVDIGLFQLPLRRGRLPVGAQLVAVIPFPDQPPGGLCRLFRLVGSLHPHVVLLGLADLPVDSAQHGIGGGVPKGMGQLGGRLLFVLEAEAHRDGPGLRVHGALPDLFLGNGSLSLIRSAAARSARRMGLASAGPPVPPW